MEAQQGQEVTVIFQSLIALSERADDLRQKLPTLADEHLRALFCGLEDATSISWMLQADIVAELKSRGTYGSNVVKGISSYLSMPERRIWELAQIHDEILSKDPTLRALPLEKGHYLVALRAKSRGLDHIELLHLAAADGSGVNVLKRAIDGDTDVQFERRYYTLSTMEFTPKEGEDVIQLKYFSPSARTVKIGGKIYLEVKTDASPDKN